MNAIKNSKRMGHQVAYHIILPATNSSLSETETPLPEKLIAILREGGIRQLYAHQADAIDLIRSGQHVVVSTPTASGKTFIYNIPVIERFLKNQNTTALYIFPLKALAQDQLRNINNIMNPLKEEGFTAAIYDGDTTNWHRKRLRENPPNILLTNPEMVHLSLLAHHPKWASFYSNLQTVVVDEVHTYRGIMGSHMSLVFRRLQRICSYYGVRPNYIFCSATVGNPSKLAEQLIGFQVKEISKSSAPRGKRHIIYYDPVDSPAQSAILLLKAALHRSLKTIVYTQSRKMTELIALWAANKSGKFSKRISAYRAGFLPEERREIESRRVGGDLLAVISTSALELGIDVGGLDLCILVGYPGSLVSTWQRGGRVGRSGQDSALILIAGEDALDQYFIQNPEELIYRAPESVVVNPQNRVILEKQLVCAAAELSLKIDETILSGEIIEDVVKKLEKEGTLLKSADGKQFYSSRKAPHRHVDLRGTGSSYTIVDRNTDRIIGEIDGFRAFKETHTGAVYLHKGDSFVVNYLDLDTKTVSATEARVDYYTRVRSTKNTEILKTHMEKPVWGTKIYSGTLKVTEQITGYERWRIYDKRKIDIIPLELPPIVFDTEGLWFIIPPEIQRKAENKYLHFMGGIHAIEHAAIGIFPLLVMADRNDLGGISTPIHPQLGNAAIFIYDGIPGGAGMSTQAYHLAEELLGYTLNMIHKCRCEQGCPSCVHSPKCGSGNRPIDKSSAKFLLKEIKDY
ncbi:MAG: DEAD/DEAH box helicase, partial [Desulfobacterales bacterium]|nr:DEAD/DEAH box helicase [Desulfobacterales bacterium]